VREGSADVTIHSSTVSGSVQDGVKIESSTAVSVVTGTQLLSNTVGGNLGFWIRLLASPDTVLEDNTVIGNVGGDVEID
jgi:hypothetical protein